MLGRCRLQASHSRIPGTLKYVSEMRSISLRLNPSVVVVSLKEMSTVRTYEGCSTECGVTYVCLSRTQIFSVYNRISIQTLVGFEYDKYETRLQ
jgi:hypothetical protein